MSYFTIQQVERTITIRNKKRISMLTPLDKFSMIIFYQDCTFEHREIYSEKIIYEGKLDFVVLNVLKPIRAEGDNNGRNQNISLYVGLVGESDDKTIIFGVLNVQSVIYHPYEIIWFETKKQSQSVKFYLLQSVVSSFPLLIMVSMNVEDGIMIQCFDFQINQWLNYVLYLGAKFFSHLTIAMPNVLGINQQNIAGLLFLANGQKSQSVHLACVGVKKDKKPINQKLESQNVDNVQKNKKLQFLFTREVKYHVNFTILGGHITENGNLLLIGNSLTFKTQERKQHLWQPQCLTMDFNNLIMNNNLDPIVKFIDLQGFRIGKQIIIRQYLGFIDNWMLFVVQNPLKRSLHRVSPKMLFDKQQHFDQQVYTLPSHKPKDIILSCDSHMLLSYELVCQQYFEKIKDSPSVIKFNILRKIDKSAHYRHILQKFASQQIQNEAFIQSVIDCL